jgi:hypothetical protein
MVDRVAVVEAAVLRERRLQCRSPQQRSRQANAMKVDGERAVVLRLPLLSLPRAPSRFVLRFGNRNNGGSRFAVPF